MSSVPAEAQSDIEYLISIQENPAAAETIRALTRDRILSAAEIAILCNEIGQLTYGNLTSTPTPNPSQSLKDPNALANRIAFFNIEDTTTYHPAIKDGRNYVAWYQQDYYYPTPEAVRHNRELHDLSLKPRPRLITYEDYILYFKQFSTPVLAALFSQIESFEFSIGCNGPCLPVCGVSPEGRVSGHMPFSVVEFIFDTFGPTMQKNQRCPSIYYATDPPDYESEEKTVLDILKLYEKHFGFMPDLSSSYRLDKKAIEYFWSMIKAGIPIWRISRLMSGNKPGDFEKLIRKISQRAAQDGETLSDTDIEQLKFTFITGEKEGYNVLIGNAIKPHTPEHKMARWSCACMHGVRFSPKGFEGMVLRPTSRLFPKQELTFPIEPNPASGEIIIPAWGFRDAQQPYFRANDGPVIPRPRFIRMSPAGELLSREEPTALERRLGDLGDCKAFLKQAQRAFMINGPMQYIDRNVEDLFAHIKYMLSKYAEDIPALTEIRMFIYEFNKLLNDLITSGRVQGENLMKYEAMIGELKLTLTQTYPKIRDFEDQLVKNTRASR